MTSTSVFAPASTPAQSIFGLSVFVFTTAGAVFVVVFSMLVYAVAKFRQRRQDESAGPHQLHGRNPIELAWIVIPILIVIALFLAGASVIASVDKVAGPRDSADVVAIGR